MSRKKALWWLLGLVVVIYIVTVCTRAFTLMHRDHYQVDNTYRAGSAVFPIQHMGFNDLKPFDSRLSDDELITVDYEKLRNLSSARGQHINPIYTGFILVHQLGRLSSQQGACAPDYACKVVRKNLDYLLDEQTKEGAWPLYFDNTISRRTLKAPWVSGLGQALAASALYQGYAQFNEPQYLAAAQRGIRVMLRPISEGGTVSLSGIIEEYPFYKNNIHVLNGYLYGVIVLSIGQYWQPELEETLSRHLELVEKSIDKYWLPGWSAYSLDRMTLRNHMTFANPMYHKLHAAQLNYLCQLGGRPKTCASAQRFENDKVGIVAFTVATAYIIFRDLTGIYKSLRF